MIANKHKKKKKRKQNIQKWIAGILQNRQLRVEMATLVVLICPRKVWRFLPEKIAQEMIESTQIDSKYVALTHEINALRTQLRFLQDLRLNYLCANHTYTDINNNNDQCNNAKIKDNCCNNDNSNNCCNNQTNDTQKIDVSLNTTYSWLYTLWQS